MFFQTGLMVLSLAVITQGYMARMIGGRNAANHMYPYQVSFRDKLGHFCSGSILNKRWILTAAHCVRDPNINNFTISAGTNFLNESGTVYEPKFNVTPEEYNHHYHYDIALVRVKKDIVFTDFVKPIRLPTEDLQDYSRPAVFTGWGYTKWKGRLSNALQELNLNLRAPEDCKKILTPISKRHICTWNKNQSICSADSGGPLVVDKVQVGIASYGKDPCGDFPDAWTRVFSYRHWILKSMHDYDTDREEILEKIPSI